MFRTTKGVFVKALLAGDSFARTLLVFKWVSGVQGVGHKIRQHKRAYFFAQIPHISTHAYSDVQASDHAENSTSKSFSSCHDMSNTTKTFTESESPKY